MNVLIHGIRKTFTDPMKPLQNALLEHGQDVFSVDYGYILIPITNKWAVSSLIKQLDKIPPHIPITVVAYSNGAWTVIQAAELGYKIDRIIMISPSLHVKHAIPDTVGRVYVYYSEGDVATLFGKYIRKIINFILPKNPHKWGAAGRYGWQGNDDRVVNIRMPDDIGHTFYKHPLIVNQIVKDIVGGYNEKSYWIL